MPTINEEWIEEQEEKNQGITSRFISYGLPEVMDLTTTEYGPTKGVKVQPKWDEIPDKIVIASAHVGGTLSKRQNPNHPIEPDEVRDEARKAIEAGASSCHFHTRDPETGYNFLSAKKYHDVIDPLKEDYPEMLFSGFTAPYRDEDWDETEQIYKDGIFDLSPINTTATYAGDSLLHEPPAEIIKRTRLMQEHYVKPQIAVYQHGDVDTANRYLLKTDVLNEPYLWLVLPDFPGGTPMHNPSDMVQGLKYYIDLIRDIPGEHEIVVCASGRASSYLAALAILMGCHIRVGTEDTIYKYPHKNDLVEDNGQDVRRYVQMAELLGREVASPSEYAEICGI
jgi:3-keto-5-aminohexanoate cleavage enzyme